MSEKLEQMRVALLKVQPVKVESPPNAVPTKGNLIKAFHKHLTVVETDPILQGVRRSPLESPHRCSLCNGPADKRFEGDTVVNHEGQNVKIHWCGSCAEEWREERISINF